MHVDEDRPTREQLDASWDETFERLRSFIASRVRDDDVAADIAQDVLVRSIAAGALQRVDNPTAWLYRSARNAVIDHYRTRHVNEPLGEMDDLWPASEPADDRPNDATRDLAGCLQPLVAQLPENYREALDRVDLAGQSHHVAAAEVGISTSGMKSRVQRARRQLKELLTDCCAVQVDRLGAVASYHPNTGTCGCPSRD
jgi:RNA polymerase sigma-70 factor (ECF subfamily)